MGTVVLVHGAWHGAWCWDRVAAELADAGIDHLAVELPLTGHEADVAAVSDALDAIDGSKVVVGHSYGGLVMSGAVEGRADVSHLVYVCAFLLDMGERVLDNLMDFEPPPLFDALRMTDDGQSYIDSSGAVAAFYAECPASVAEAAVAKLRPMDPNSTAHPCLGEPWKQVPTTYVVCERDGAILSGAQRRMARRATTVLTLDTDHSPFLSRVSETAAIIAEVATG
jgi:pimeloyl-ACP methyl ester carboxylesterase